MVSSIDPVAGTIFRSSSAMSVSRTQWASGRLIRRARLPSRFDPEGFGSPRPCLSVNPDNMARSPPSVVFFDA